jgi:hypothetical protein
MFKALKYCCFMVLLTLIGQSMSFALNLPSIPNKPVDFWGIYWADSPDKLGNDKVLFRKNQKRQGEVYDIKRNDISFEDFQISQVRYVFYYKKLTDVVITISDKNNDDIFARTKKIFGKPVSFSKEGLTEYIWMDDEIMVTLAMSAKSFPHLNLPIRNYSKKCFLS